MSMTPDSEVAPERGSPAAISPLKSDSRVPELDGIRGVAILLVVFFHYFEIPQDAGWFAKTGNAVLSFGWSGVDLFFVLSGFLIGGILMENRGSASYFRTFYIRRICRIFPLYFLWLSLYYLLPLILPPHFPGYAESFGREIFRFPKWGYIFFLQNFYTAITDEFGSVWMAATWSLAVEEQFYLLLPAVIWLVFPRKLLPTVLVLIALVPVLRIFLFLFHSSLFLYVLLPCRADALLLGVFCACLLRREKSRAWLAQNGKILYALLFCLLAGVGYVISLGYGYSAKKVFDSFDMAAFGFTAVALFYACLLLIAVSQRKSRIAGLLRLRLLRHFGVIAYGMFLIHFAVRAVVQGFIFGTGASSAGSFSQNLVAVLAFLVTWLLAVLSWRYFEQPIVRWGHSFRYAAKKADREVVASA